MSHPVSGCEQGAGFRRLARRSFLRSEPAPGPWNYWTMYVWHLGQEVQVFSFNS